MHLALFLPWDMLQDVGSFSFLSWPQNQNPDCMSPLSIGAMGKEKRPTATS